MIKNAIREAISYPGRPSCCVADWRFDSAAGVYDDTCLESYRDYANLVTNGDFRDGTTGFVAEEATIAVSNNVLSITGSGTQTYPLAHQTITGGAVINHKIYVKILQRVTNANCLQIDFSILETSGDTFPILALPVLNHWYTNSGIHVNTGNGDLRIRFVHSYADAATANGKVMEVSQVMAIDLTSTFGAGNEPSLTECDALFPFTATTGKARYTHKGTVSGATQVGLSRYFDGTDDYISMPNSPLLDVTSAPLAVFATVQITNSQRAYIICKNIDASSNSQYAIIFDQNGGFGGNASSFVAFMQGGTPYIATSANSIIIGNKYDVGFIWEGTTMKMYLNGIKVGTDKSYSSSLTSRPNIRFGNRGGSDPLKGNIYNVAEYAGNTFNADEILAHRRAKMQEFGIAG